MTRSIWKVRLRLDFSGSLFSDAKRNDLHVIDLSHPIKTGMPRFGAAWHVATEIRPLGRIENVGRNTMALAFGSHCGTHMDAASHFISGGQTIDRIPLDKLVGPVSLVDCSRLPDNHPLTPEDFDRTILGERVIFFFDWARFWESDKFYRGYPYFTESAAQALVERGVKLVGMDTPSPDDSRAVLGSEADSIIHKRFLGAGVTLVEYLANLDKVDLSKAWNICVLPLPIAGGDGSPVRACLFRDE